MNGEPASTKLTYVNVPMKAKRMQNAIPKTARNEGFLMCSAQAASGERAVGPIAVIGGALCTVK
jgi:hypothetical protein